MIHWAPYLKNLKSRIQQIGKLNPDIITGYLALSNSKPPNPKLEPKTRELIALAVAVTTRCDGCIVSHTDAAKKHGVTEEEITEALGIAIAVNAGAALVYTARTLDAYSNLK